MAGPARRPPLDAHGCGTWAFTGGRPADRTGRALAAAAAALCVEGGCGTCRVCRDPTTHPDFHAAGASDPGTVPIDDVRALCEAMRLAGHASPLRIGFLPEAQRLEAAAAAALLKSLEEPPRGAWYLLTAPSPASLPDAVRSRCAFLGVGAAGALEPPLDAASAASLREAFEAAVRGSDPTVLADRLAAGKEKRDEAQPLLRRHLVALAAWLRDASLPGAPPLATDRPGTLPDRAPERLRRLLDLVEGMDRPLYLPLAAEHAALVCAGPVP